MTQTHHRGQRQWEIDLDRKSAFVKARSLCLHTLGLTQGENNVNFLFFTGEENLKKLKPGIKLGYLGGGQLARMLAESASHFGLQAHVLSENSNDPAAQVTGYWQKGSPKNKAQLRSFLKKVDVATFESEFLDPEILQDMKKETKTKIYPSPSIMGILRDRKSQKRLFDLHHLPTSAWNEVNTEKEVLTFVDQFQLPLVFKKRVFGYDGYGTFVVKTPFELANFLRKDFKKDTFIVEDFIPFEKECAIIMARSADKSITHLPMVESFQQDSRCDWVKGPVKIKRADALINQLKKFLTNINYVGVMGVELFVTRHGLIINEIAPRVHNTGHYSLSTPGLSQFDLHNMCLLGQKLPKMEIKTGFAMANLIGSGRSVQLQPMDELYWYGKEENRKGRKMGHINALGSTSTNALKKALQKRKEIKL